MTTSPPTLVRRRLIDLVAWRWSGRIVTIVGGPGFGKSTLLAQAIADDADRQRGSDHLLVASPLDAGPAQLAMSLARVHGLDPSTIPTVLDFVTAARELPLGRSLLIDDAHQIAATPAGIAALDLLVDQRPAHLGLVLVSRTALPLPSLQRRGAAGEIIEIGESDLRLSDDEQQAIAELSGADLAAVRASGGWAALAGLTAGHRPGGPLEFVHQHVLDDLDEPTRRALAVASHLQRAPVDLIEAALGETVDVAALAAVPLVTVVNDEVTVHSLWASVDSLGLDDETARTVDRAAGVWWMERGDLDRAVPLLIRSRHTEGLRRAFARACAAGYFGHGPRMIDQWLNAIPPDVGDYHETRVLEAISARAASPFSSEAVTIARAAMHACREAGAWLFELVAIMELLLLGRVQGSRETLVELLRRLDELHDRRPDFVEPAQRTCRALLAELDDDDQALLAEVDALPPELVQLSRSVPITMLRASALLLLGDPTAALVAAQQTEAIAARRFPTVRSMVHLAQWWCEITPDLVAATPRIEHAPDATQVDRLMMGARSALVLAFAGRTVEADRQLRLAERELVAQVRPEFVGWIAIARAALELADGRVADATATATLHRFFDIHPTSTPVGRRTARFAPAIVTLLLPEAATAITAMSLLPDLADTIATARLLADLRAGHPVGAELVAHGRRRCTHAIPLALAPELAERLGRVDESAATAVVRQFLGAYGPAAVAVLGERRSHLGPGARAEVAAASTPLRVSVLGPTEARVGDAPGGEELRRARVRQLLTYLAVHPPMARDVVIAALWPDLDRRAGRRNLRVTLTHLNRALGPASAWGIVGEGDLLALSDPPAAHVDVRDFNRLLSRARAEATAGQLRAELDALEHALAFVTGPPLLDVRDDDWAVDIARALTTDAVRAALRAAQLRHAEGDHDRAEAHARLALSLEPWSEPAFRLLAASQAALGDRIAALRTIDACRARLAEIGVVPEPETQQLDRRLRGS